MALGMREREEDFLLFVGYLLHFPFPSFTTISGSISDPLLVYASPAIWAIKIFSPIQPCAQGNIRYFSNISQIKSFKLESSMFETNLIYFTNGGDGKVIEGEQEARQSKPNWVSTPPLWDAISALRARGIPNFGPLRPWYLCIPMRMETSGGCNVMPEKLMLK
ncbi:hypothetical protein FIBSPDRAFT_1056001 [Athelia psychrophila]|uniref:Uncharacterized protein n=1 Tax=Athelia psychrophila TaxID=1759441 RepID=A0A167SST4_9AGAM|nr:hypothetical protein FIBSPDRAFT_1056001 [Fibularhizoctonia sp. CBS 109695]